MAAVKTAVVCVVALLSVFLPPGIRPQPTIGYSTENDSFSQLEEALEIQVVENVRLRSLLESERQTIKTLENKLNRLELLLPVTSTFLRKLNISGYPSRMTKVEESIFALSYGPPTTFEVFEDRMDFRFIREIRLYEVGNPGDIVYSNESKCVYISDYEMQCIWRMTTTGEHRLTKWLTNVTNPNTLWLSNEGNLLVLKDDEPFSQLYTYSLSANLIGSLELPQEIKKPRHVVQTLDGNFIILHRQNNASSGPWVISQLTSDGQLINRFIPRNQYEKLSEPFHLSLDSENYRLFVADSDNSRVILMDSSTLTWSKVLICGGIRGVYQPWRMFYDASKKHLFVSQWQLTRHNVLVFEIN